MNLIVNVIFTILSYQALSFCNCDDTTDTSQSDEVWTEQVQINRYPQRTRWGNQSFSDMVVDKKLKRIFRQRMRRIKKQDMQNRKRFETLPFAHDLKRDQYDCFFKLPKDSPPGYYTPIPYRTDQITPRIMYPDIHGVINVKKNGFFKFACPGSRFMPPIDPVEEIMVKCLKKLFIKYKGKVYWFKNFSCETIPKPTVQKLNRTCQGDKSVLEVGFQTEEHFFGMYRICFNPELSTPIYSWYVRRKPMYRHRQIAWKNPTFMDSDLGHYKDIDVEKLYKTFYLKQTVMKTVKSVNLTDTYINFPNKRMLKPYDLTSFFDFVYIFEQDAAFITENSVPVWMFFTYYVWKDVERSFRYDMANGQNRQVVVSGTYQVLTLRDLDYVSHPLYFAPSGRMPVPMFVWKMDYNLDTKSGLVYVGLNNPYSWFNITMKICEPVPCRQSLVVRRKYHPAMLYCCTKESFEKTYGELDPIVFEEYNT